MGNCLFMGCFLVLLLLGTSCLWNCYQHTEPSSDGKWHGCRDQEGRQVDSYILYKLPTDKSSQYLWIQKGLGYVYLTPDSPDSLKQSEGGSSVLSYTDSASGWLLSNISIAHQSSMPGATLQRLYSHSPDIVDDGVYLMYNDEFPNGTTSVTHGHTKGVVVMTEHGGFWLVHSTPRYPPAPAHSAGGYDYPHSGTRYGQTFMCISLPPEQADNLAWQLLQNKPYLYSGAVGTKAVGRFPVLERVLRREAPPTGSVFRVTQLATQRGATLTSFAKYTKFGKDLYSDLVAPTLKTGLFVESWRNGPNPLPSYCNSTQYKVQNVEQVSMVASGSSFSSHHDHSKWAVSSSQQLPYVCVGDINRMASQYHRAGGTVCTWSPAVWNNFRRLVTQAEPCKGAL